jgi:stage II sporulation protein D
MAKRKDPAKYPYHVVATTLDQVYGGYGTMSGSTVSPLETANSAVNETEGVVGKYNGQYITALFSSNAGGRTENNVYVFGSDLPYLKSVDSSWDSVDNRDLKNSTYKWAVTFDKAALESKLNIFGIQEVIINNSTTAGRVQAWKIKTTRSEINITESQLQIRAKLNLKSRLINSIVTERPTRVLTELNYNLGSEVAVLTAVGPQNITLGSDTVVISGNNDPAIAASSVLTNIEDYRVLGIDIVPAKFTFNGKGYGHGVGLSQWGSNGMAKDGYKYDGILKHYYQGVSLVTDY